jgi:DUF971 family protein
MDDGRELIADRYNSRMTPATTPVRLDLKRDEKLTIAWQDGQTCTYSLSLLRSMCPCAQCKVVREEQHKRKSLLTILPGNYAGQITVINAQLVGNYALKIEWSDQHDSGIYSFDYLREICPRESPSARQ